MKAKVSAPAIRVMVSSTGCAPKANATLDADSGLTMIFGMNLFAAPVLLCEWLG
jgi:hypothetical protein